MIVSVVTTVIGIFALDEKGQIIDKVIFKKNIQNIASKLLKIDEGQIVEEIASLIRKIKRKGFKEMIFENKSLALTISKNYDIDTSISTSNDLVESFRERLEKYAIELDFISSSENISTLIHDISIEMSKIKVSKVSGKRDLLIIQSIQALDEIDKTLNLFSGRLREWYGLHFPELSSKIDRHEEYAKLVSNLGNKDDFTAENLIKNKISKTKIQKIKEIVKSSMGADLIENDINPIRSFSNSLIILYKERASLEKYIEQLMKEVAPNIAFLAGPILGARLISVAGSIQSLAKKPSSTIQVLGAEKALFRSLTTNALPPKHGLIFQHSMVHGTRRNSRGKAARAVAGKLAIAARADAFTDHFIAEDLRTQLESRIKEILKKKK